MVAAIQQFSSVERSEVTQPVLPGQRYSCWCNSSSISLLWDLLPSQSGYHQGHCLVRSHLKIKASVFPPPVISLLWSCDSHHQIGTLQPENILISKQSKFFAATFCLMLTVQAFGFFSTIRSFFRCWSWTPASCGGYGAMADGPVFRSQ